MELVRPRQEKRVGFAIERQRNDFLRRSGGCTRHHERGNEGCENADFALQRCGHNLFSLPSDCLL
jgi:hypothetical protein